MTIFAALLCAIVFVHPTKRVRYSPLSARFSVAIVFSSGPLLCFHLQVFLLALPTQRLRADRDVGALGSLVVVAAAAAAVEAAAEAAAEAAVAAVAAEVAVAAVAAVVAVAAVAAEFAVSVPPHRSAPGSV